MIEKIDHVCIMVRDIDKAIEIYREVLGLQPLPVEIHETLGIKICLVPVGEVMIEFVQPSESNINASQFLKEKGGGLHHIAFRVKNIDQAMTIVEQNGLKLRDKESRPGAAGSRIAFIETDNATFTSMELVERQKKE